MDQVYMFNALLGATENESCNYTCSPRCIPQGSIALTILSSLGSIVGSLLIIGTFLRWKDLRTVARMILVFLAIADLFTGIGYLFGAAIYLNYQSNSPYCRDHHNSSTLQTVSTTYDYLCTVQSFFTTLMPMASFLWTANLSIYLFFSIGLQKIDFAKKLMIPFHLTAWGIPLVTCIVILGLHEFGPSYVQSSGAWCWIKSNYSSSNDLNMQRRDYTKQFIMELVAGKMWEIAVCLLSLALCIAIKVSVWRRYKIPKVTAQKVDSSSSINLQLRAAFTKVDQKLIWIPIVFLLLRMWGIIRFFISNPSVAVCPSERQCTLLYNKYLIYMQGIGDPGQGWSNALLFVIFHHTIFQRLCPCLYLCGKWCQGACDSTARRLRKKATKNPKCVNGVGVVKKVTKRDLMDGGIVVYKSERTPLISDAPSSSVLYTVSEDLDSIRKHRVVSPDPDATSINIKFTSSTQ